MDVEIRELGARLARRMDRFSWERDPALVLNDDAMLEFDRFRALVAAADPDPDLLRLAASFHWCRYLCLPDGVDAADLSWAVQLFAWSTSEGDESVPEPLRPLVDEVRGDLATDDTDPALAEAERPASEDAPGSRRRDEAVAGASAWPGDEQTAAFAIIRVIGGLQRAMNTHEPELLDEVINELRRLSLAPFAHDGLRAEVLGNLGVALQIRSEQGGGRDDLEDSVRSLRAAVALPHHEFELRGLHRNNLASSLRLLFQYTGRPAVLREAAALGRQSLLEIAPDPAVQARSLANVGDILALLAAESDDVPLLDEAVSLLVTSVDEGPVDADLPSRLSDLVLVLLGRHARTGSPRDVDLASIYAARAWDLLDPRHPAAGMALANIAAVHQARFAMTGAPEDLEQATLVLVNGLARIGGGNTAHPGLPAASSALAELLYRRFELTDDPELLNSALAAAATAVRYASSDRRKHPQHLASSAGVLWAGAEISGSLETLDEAIRRYEDVLGGAARPGDVWSAAASRLCGALRFRYELSGDESSLDKAVEIGRLGVAEAHSRRWELANSLANALQQRYRRNGDIGDLEEAIELRRNSAALAVGPDRALHASGLGHALGMRFDRLGRPADLIEGVESLRTARELLSSRHVERVGIAVNLAFLVALRYRLMGRRADADEAVTLLRDTLEERGEDHVQRGVLYNGLGGVLGDRARREHDRAGLDESVAAHRAAVASTSDSRTNHAIFTLNLARSLESRARMEPDVAAGARNTTAEDRSAAVGHYRAVAELSTAPVELRVQGARGWGALAHEAADGRGAAVAYRMAVELLPRLAWHGLGRPSREGRLAHANGLSNEAASAALADGRTADAVELLEHGRTILWLHQLALRTERDDLAARNPALARRLDEVQFLLEMAGDSERPRETAAARGDRGRLRH